MAISVSGGEPKPWPPPLRLNPMPVFLMVSGLFFWFQMIRPLAGYRRVALIPAAAER